MYISFFIGEGRGRFGNQFLVYMVFLQLKRQLGVDSYINKECEGYVKAFFTDESIQLPVLSEVYCNPEAIKSNLIGYSGPFKDLVNDEKWRKGKLIEFYPPVDGGDTGGYRPEDHAGPEQDAFNKVSLIELIRIKTYLVTRLLHQKNETKNSPIYQLTNLKCCKMSLK